MSLYAIGDLHLHFGSELKAKNQRTDPAWRGHEERFRKNCANMLRERDTLVLAGDHSWGRKIEECEKDFEYIMSLPGKKVLLRGNHDMFWDAKKTRQLNERYEGRLFFLQDNYFPYKDCALVGTKGYTFEGPFWVDARRRIVRWDEAEEAKAAKLVERELARLRTSFEAARADGCTRFVMFLHYPPTSVLEKESGFTRMAEEYGAEQVIYAHCHGATRFHDSLQGMKNGVRYSLVSGDYLQWTPLRVMA